MRYPDGLPLQSRGKAVTQLVCSHVTRLGTTTGRKYRMTLERVEYTHEKHSNSPPVTSAWDNLPQQRRRYCAPDTRVQRGGYSPFTAFHSLHNRVLRYSDQTFCSLHRSIPMAMSSSRAPLLQSNEKALRLINLVYERATPKQWVGWLRVPLEHAAATGDVGLVNDMLTAGAGGNAGWKGWHNRSLSVSVQGGHHEVVAALLTAAATPDVNTRSGEKRQSPLHHAASGGHTSIVKLLLMSGADVECVDRDGRSPLHLAVLGNHKHVVDELLDNGAPPNCSDEIGNAPILIAASFGRDEIVSSLLRNDADINIRGHHDISPLYLATYRGHLSTVEALLAAGADVGLRDSDDCSALDAAASKGHVDIMKALLRHGADVMSRSAVGITALHLAVERNQACAVEALVEAGADVDARINDQIKWSPLHCAAYKGNLDAMRVLLRGGNKADIDALDIEGRSPLAFACMHLQQEAVELLLRRGADYTIVDNEGLSAHQLVGISPTTAEMTAEAKTEAGHNILSQLERAPADRAWRRRRLLVLCRAFDNRSRLGLVRSNEGVGRGMKRQRSGVGRRTQAKIQACSGDEGVGGTLSNMVGGGHEAHGSLRKTEARVVGLAQESLFRLIVSFL